MVKIPWYFIVLAVGFCFLIGWFGRGILADREAAKLNDQLKSVRISLADATSANGELSKSNTKLQQQLDDRDSILAGQKQQLGSQQQLIAGQQRTIDEAKRGLAAFAESLSNGTGDLESRAKSIADGFAKLYAVYHPGAKISQSP